MLRLHKNYLKSRPPRYRHGPIQVKVFVWYSNGNIWLRFIRTPQRWWLRWLSNRMSRLLKYRKESNPTDKTLLKCKGPQISRVISQYETDSKSVSFKPLWRICFKIKRRLVKDYLSALSSRQRLTLKWVHDIIEHTKVRSGSIKRQI